MRERSVKCGGSLSIKGLIRHELPLNGSFSLKARRVREGPEIKPRKKSDRSC